MAGGKETPRQKMIGMMYLVLTALLALQVSSAIIEKFKFLDDSLQFANANTTANNVLVEKKIDKAVKDGGGKDAPVLKKANDVRIETEKVLSELRALRTELIDITGGWEDETKTSYKGAKEETKIEVLMVGAEGSKNGKAYKLQTRINDYAKKIADITGDKELGKRICLDAKESPMFKDSKEQGKKDFAELNFAQTPMVAALAVISTIQADVLKREAQALEDLAAQVGATDLKFDVVTATYTAKSSVVAAGTYYEADIFLSASSASLVPTFKMGGSTLPVDNGRGKIKFKASGGSYDKEGNVKKSVAAEIHLQVKGKDSIFPVKLDYIVARPVIQVQSATVSALYVNCGNELQINVPALGSSYNPSFTASGAQVIRGGQKGQVTIVPNGSVPRVTINVSSDGTAIGSETFNLRTIPRPDIVAKTGGKPVDEKSGMAAPGPRQINVVAEAEPGFKSALPKDARYRVTEWNCMLVRGKRPVAQMKFNGEAGNLSTFAAQAVPGDRILIEVTKVQRTNFQNKVEEVKIGTVIKNIPLH